MLGAASGYFLSAAAVLSVVAGLYRILSRRDRDRYHDRDRDRGTPEKAMSSVLGELDGLFSPGAIHWQRERQRMAMMRENPESGDPPFGPIDLLSGTVVIRQPTEKPAPGEDPGSPGS